ncbi:MAG: hypothetical protein C0594_10820 [Marinilabiliales bacterium]|nr:MAG: hypothetical protein C0594_10820 [Marinilabiliales bacterium]
MTTKTVKKSRSLSGGIGTKDDVKKTDTTTKPVIFDSKERRAKVQEATAKEEVKPIVEKVEIPAPPKPQLSLDEKIAVVENLQITIEKREKLLESRKKLNSFVIGSHQFSENIVLTDGQGNSFKASNTEVFGKVVDLIREILDTKIKELEQDIKF